MFSSFEMMAKTRCVMKVIVPFLCNFYSTQDFSALIEQKLPQKHRVVGKYDDCDFWLITDITISNASLACIKSVSVEGYFINVSQDSIKLIVKGKKSSGMPLCS